MTRLACLLALAACRADLPELTDARATDAITCTGPNADTLVSYTTGAGESLPAEGTKALGPPDGIAVALDANATLVVGFLGLGAIPDNDGDDIEVVATVAAGGAAAVYVAGPDGTVFAYAGQVDESTSRIDLAIGGTRQAAYARLVGLVEGVAVDALNSLQAGCRAP